MNRLTIKIRRDGERYVAIECESGMLYHGSSPDEALGWLIRDNWLSENLATPVQITIDSRPDEDADDA